MFKGRAYGSVDKEARWGYKSEGVTFGGYKAEILATEKGFITGFRVLTGNTNEGGDISPLIEEEKKSEGNSGPISISKELRVFKREKD